MHLWAERPVPKHGPHERAKRMKRWDGLVEGYIKCAAVARTATGAAMLSVTSATRVLVATTPVDLRGSFNRLHSLVVEQLKGDPLSGHLFVFTNGRRNRVKVLYWDGSGLWVCAKRLEQGRFTWPVSESGQIDLRGEEFSALIHGLEVRSKESICLTSHVWFPALEMLRSVP